MTPITLEEADAKRVRALMDREVAIRQFIERVTQHGEEKLRQQAAEAREVWQAIALKYGIDIESVVWGLAQDGKRLLPLQARFNHA